MHNNYLTLPVVFLMLSNHYPLFFATQYNWVIVAIVLLIGPVIRHFFNARHQGKDSPWWTWAVAAAGVMIIIWLSGTGAGIKMGALPEVPKFAVVQDIVMSRCGMCHAAEPVWARHRHRAERRAARRCGADQAACQPDRHQCGAVQGDAAGQRHRNDCRGAA